MPLISTASHHHHHQQQHPHHPHHGVNPDASYSMLFSPAASSLASTPGGNNNHNGGGGHCGTSASGGGAVELELHWDPPSVRCELLQASAILSHRGLKLASKWAAEQVMGVATSRGGGQSHETTGGDDEYDDDVHHDVHDDDDDDPPDDSSVAIPMATLVQEMTQLRERDWYAKSLLDLGDYLHAASVLSQNGNEQQPQHNSHRNHQHSSHRNSSGKAAASSPTAGSAAASRSGKATDITQMGPPQHDLSPYGFYLRAYALYMAGERRKEEEYVEMERCVCFFCRLFASLLLALASWFPPSRLTIGHGRPLSPCKRLRPRTSAGPLSHFPCPLCHSLSLSRPPPRRAAVRRRGRRVGHETRTSASWWRRSRPRTSTRCWTPSACTCMGSS